MKLIDDEILQSFDFYKFRKGEAGFKVSAKWGMINFEEELERFQPSLEVEQAEDAICNNDSTDVMDIIKEMMKEYK